MITECQKKDIKVLLTYLPFPADEMCQKEAKKMEELAKKYDIQCINFLNKDVVDLTTDMYDSDSHLNPFGASKTTDYIGKILVKDYKVENHKDDLEYDNWKKYDAMYSCSKKETLKGLTDIKDYLVGLNFSECNAIIEVKNTSFLLNDIDFIKLLNKNGLEINKDEVSSITQDRTYLIDVKENKVVPITIDCEQDTTFGKVAWYQGEKKTILYLNGEECWKYNEKDEADLYIIVLDKNGQIVDKVIYDSKMAGLNLIRK